MHMHMPVRIIPLDSRVLEVYAEPRQKHTAAQNYVVVMGPT